MTTKKIAKLCVGLLNEGGSILFIGKKLLIPDPKTNKLPNHLQIKQERYLHDNLTLFHANEYEGKLKYIKGIFNQVKNYVVPFFVNGKVYFECII